MKNSMLATMCIAGLASGSALAQGQQPSQQPPPPPPPQQQAPQMPQQQQQTVDVSDAELQKFARIYVDVQKTRDELSSELSGTESQEQAQEIQARMRSAIMQTIEDHDWSIEQYNRVATAISSDPDMREEALEIINNLSS
ncbi:MAG: DUF4168 domain-containing protein [Woeseia sp.]